MTARPTFRGRSFPYLHTDEVADLLNEAAGRCTWDSRKAKRHLQRVGAAKKVGGRWVTTRDLLRERCEELWAELVWRLADSEAGEEAA